MPDLKVKKPLWAMVASWTLCLLPVLYLLGSGPGLRLAQSKATGSGAARVLYTPVLWLIGESQCPAILTSYLLLWNPDGIEVPIYSSNREVRARQMIYESENLHEITEAWEREWFNGEE